MSTTLIVVMLIVALFALGVGFLMGAFRNNRRYDAETVSMIAAIRADMDRQSEEASK